MLWMAVQVAPDSSQEIASVVRFARAAFNAGITLEEVGEILNLTRERIRQVEVFGLEKLKIEYSDLLGDD